MKNTAALLMVAVLSLSLVTVIFAQEVVQPTTEMTIRQIAHDVGLKGRELAEQFGLPGQVNKDTPLSKLGITQQQLESVLVNLPALSLSVDGQGTAANTDMTLQEAAHALGMTGKELAYTLGLSVEVDKQTPLKELGVTDEKLSDAVRHAAHETGNIDWLKYPIWVLVSITALVFLLRDRARKAIYLSVLTFSLFTTGFALGKAPNPMESVSKIFKTAVGVYPDVTAKVLAFIFFCLLAVVGNKIICGWGCPFGALQELFYELPLGRAISRLRKKQLPLVLTNSLRAVFFAAFLLVVFGIIGNRKGLVLYHYVNVFNLFDFEFELLSILISIILFTVISSFVYRSFCQFVCPFGFISWFLERVSLAGVRVNRDNCTECRACASACPLEAMKGRLDRHRFPADCFSCARCLRSCNYNALDYRWRWEKTVNSEQ
jgi:ferredoxin